MKKKQHPINLFFDKVFVLNMESEIKKREAIKKKFNHLGLDYEIFNAVNGKARKFDRLWEIYSNRPLATYFEKSYKKKFIESRGALGYLKTMEALLKHAIKDNLENIIIFDNDCIFDTHFNQKINVHLDFIKNIKWKIFLLGASDYGLKDRKETPPYYTPIKFKTCGSFATAINRSCFHEILNELMKNETPFDNMPLGLIYEKYPKECFVVYPNIVIAEVANSTIRESRNQDSHSKNMGWKLENFKK